MLVHRECTLALGVHLQLTPSIMSPKFYFSPWGCRPARCTHCTRLWCRWRISFLLFILLVVDSWLILLPLNSRTRVPVAVMAGLPANCYSLLYFFLNSRTRKLSSRNYKRHSVVWWKCVSISWTVYKAWLTSLTDRRNRLYQYRGLLLPVAPAAAVTVQTGRINICRSLIRRNVNWCTSLKNRCSSWI